MVAVNVVTHGCHREVKGICLSLLAIGYDAQWAWAHVAYVSDVWTDMEDVDT